MRSLKKQSPVQKQNAKYILEELEPRQLMSGGIEGLVVSQVESPAATYLDVDSGGEQTSTQSDEVSTASAAEQQTHEIVFVDTGVENYQALVDDLLNNADSNRNIEVVLLDSDRNGIEQISEALQNQDGLDAIHIISHGSDGSIQLGNSNLDAEALSENYLKISLWANAFSESGDILIYGCNLAATDLGQSLINELSELTLTDVAASDDLTGNASRGGDWELEYNVGQIESQIAVSAMAQQQIDVVLATVAQDDFSSGDYTGGTGWTGGWVDSHDGDPSAGRMGVSGGALYIDENGGSHNIYREADLSALSDGTLSYDYRGNFIVSTGTYTVEVGYGGGNWRTVATHVVSADDPGFIASGDITLNASELASDFQIRISSSGADADTKLEIDNVLITNVTANTAPVATGNTVIANEDVPLVIGVSDFIFTDTEGDSLASVTITGLNLNGGTLTHSAGAVTVINGMTITAAQLADLTFTSASNDSTNSSFTYTVNDAGTGITSAVMNITVNAVNDDPVITSDGGGATAAINVSENSTVVTTVTANDVDLDTPTFSITGGADQGLFSIDLNSGLLTFNTPPNYEGPGDNSYEVEITAADGNSGTDVQTITVNVTDVNETVTIGDGVLLSDRNVWGGGYNFGVNSFTLSTDTGTDTLTDVTVTFSGTDVNDVSANGVKIWRDDGSIPNQWDENDTLLGTATFVGNTATFTGLSEPINTSSTQYLVTYNVDNNATPGNTLQAAVTALTVDNGAVNNDSASTTLTVAADLVHETSVYKAVLSPGLLEELYLKNSSSPTTNISNGMSIGSIYAASPGSLLQTWDPDATVTTIVDNNTVKQVQMTGRLFHTSGASYGSVTTDIFFYEDRMVMDVSITMDTALSNEWMFMTYATWDDAILDESFLWSNNDSGSFNTVDPAPNFSSGNVAAPISYQGLFELGATDGFVNSTLQNISGLGTVQIKNTDNDTGTVDIAYQKQNPTLGTNYQASIQYSFDATTTGFDATIAEQRQDDFITPAGLNFGIAGGDGALVGDGYSETRGSYTLDDSDADDHVRFEFQATTTHHAPVFEVSNWNSADPIYLLVDDVIQVEGIDFNAGVTGSTLYLQFLGNVSTNAIFEISPNLDSTITGAVAGQTVNDNSTISPFSGITIADADSPAQTLSVSVTLDNGAKGIFSVLNGFTDAGGGVYTFSGTAAAATTAIQGLVYDPTDNRVAPTLTETTTFTISVDDGIETPITNNLTTVISTSISDAAVIGGADAGAVTEDVAVVANNISTSGVLTITDPDTGESTFVAATINGTYGDLIIDSAGNWSYSADNTQAAIQALDVTESLTDTLTVTSFDGTTHNVVMTINGSEDAAVIAGTTTGSVAEDGTLTSSGTLTISDVDSSDTPSFADVISTAGDNAYGSFVMTAGTWTYTLDNANAAVQALDVGETLTDTYTFTASDGSTQLVTVTINGAEDAPVFDSAAIIVATEDVAYSYTITTSDVDGEALTITATTLPAWLTFVDNGDGTATLSGTPTNAEVGSHSVVLNVSDGTLSSNQSFTIAVANTNDAAVIAGVDTGSVTEDVGVIANNISTSGLLTIADPDTGESSFIAATITGTYGDLTLDTAGNWSYSADNTQGAIQALDVTESLTDTLTVSAFDGTTHNVVITINGSEDAAVIAGTTTGSVTEDGTLTSAGTLTISDVDSSDTPSFADVGVIAGDNSYGTFVMTSGTWTYTLDNANATVQALDVGETLSDTHTFTATDGSTQLVAVTINGTEDTAVIGGTSTGSVAEDGTLTVSDTLTISDVDTSDNPITFNDQVATAGDNDYGNFELTSGTWTYTLNNTYPTVQALDVGETLNDTYTFTATDGSTQVVTVTINGTEDAAVIGGTSTGVATEDGTLTVSNTLTIADVDTNDNPISFNNLTPTLGDNGYGDFEITGNTWTFTLNNAHASVQALDVGEILNDTYTFTASDGSTQVVTVTINGAEDAALIGGTSVGSVAEDGTLTVSNTLTITDADSSDNPISFADLASTPGDNAYGSFVMTSGTWTYTLDNANAAVQALDAGETLNDTYTFTATDGSTQVVTVTINGAEDAVTLNTAIADQVAIEGSPFSFTLVANTFGDVDTSDTLTYTATLADNSALPAWLSFNAGTQVFSGTPANADIGSIDVKVSADDGSSTVTDTFQITVNNVVNPVIVPPVIAPAPSDPTPEPVAQPAVIAPVTDTGGGNSETTPPSEIVQTTATVNEEVISSLDDHIDNLVGQIGVTDSIQVQDNTADSNVNQSGKKTTRFNQQDNSKESLQQQALQDQLSNQVNLSLYASSDDDMDSELEKQLWVQMDTMRKQMHDDGAQQDEHEVEAQIVLGSAASLTAGVVGWILRGGSLLASLMSTVPVLNRFDPLPILKNSNKRENVTPDDDDTTSTNIDSPDKVDKLFSSNRDE